MPWTRRPRQSGSRYRDSALNALAFARRLKVDAQNKVDLASTTRICSSKCANAAKIGGVKVHRSGIGRCIEKEICVIERVDDVKLEFNVGFLIEARPFGKTEIHLSESRSIDRVAWEVAERAWRGRRKQSWFERRARKLPRRVPGDVQQVRIEEEHTIRRLEDASGVLEIVKGDPHELRTGIWSNRAEL